jgi:hypothetical protein
MRSSSSDILGRILKLVQPIEHETDVFQGVNGHQLRMLKDPLLRFFNVQACLLVCSRDDLSSNRLVLGNATEDARMSLLASFVTFLNSSESFSVMRSSFSVFSVGPVGVGDPVGAAMRPTPNPST